ncbi:LysE family translocator [Thiofilum flexile]|uniref:LysE family translocator n=1 Tax=Thiofilum flexile TaxID=125627 RepID=UPI000379DCC3|nr:LysE family translocator [Thiofilum flexile]
MDTQLLLAILSFAFVTSITPGPNNLMLLASGANFGFKRTIPHMLGISLGMAVLLLCILAGLGTLFTQLPLAQTALKVLGAAYLLWLAAKIALAPVGELKGRETGNAKPMTWWQASLFQFVNPKAWMMALGAVSSFTLTGEHYWWSGMVLIFAFSLVNLPSVSVWAGFGMMIQHWLSNAKRQRYFNWMMGILTALTVLMMLR